MKLLISVIIYLTVQKEYPKAVAPALYIERMAMTVNFVGDTEDDLPSLMLFCKIFAKTCKNAHVAYDFAGFLP